MSKLKEKLSEKKEKFIAKKEEKKEKFKSKINHVLNIPTRVKNLQDLKSLSQEELDFCFNAQEFETLENEMNTGDILLFSGLESTVKFFLTFPKRIQ